jgi:hypothetical protein
MLLLSYCVMLCTYAYVHVFSYGCNVIDMVRQSMDRLADDYARHAQPIMAACCHLAVSDPMVCYETTLIHSACYLTVTISMQMHPLGLNLFTVVVYSVQLID